MLLRRPVVAPVPPHRGTPLQLPHQLIQLLRRRTPQAAAQPAQNRLWLPLRQEVLPSRPVSVPADRRVHLGYMRLPCSCSRKRPRLRRLALAQAPLSMVLMARVQRLPVQASPAPVQQLRHPMSHWPSALH